MNYIPFLDQENNLFYSSDGIKGFGGYDIYFCRYNGSGWDKPVNLTQEINTPNDDIAFTMSRLDGKSAFFTTRLKTFNRSTQLFKITFRDQYAVNSVKNLPGVFKYIALAELSPAETVVAAANKQTEVKQEDKKTTQPAEKQVAEKPAAKPVPTQNTTICSAGFKTDRCNYLPCSVFFQRKTQGKLCDNNWRKKI